MIETKYVQLTSNCYIDDQMFARCDEQNDKCSFYASIYPDLDNSKHKTCKYLLDDFCTNAHAVKAIQYPVAITTTSCPSCSAWSNLPKDDFSEEYKRSTPIDWDEAKYDCFDEEYDQDYIDAAMMCGNDLTEPIKLKTGKTRAGKSVKVKSKETSLPSPEEMIECQRQQSRDYDKILGEKAAQRLEEAIKESETQFEKMVKNSPNICIKEVSSDHPSKQITAQEAIKLAEDNFNRVENLINKEMAEYTEALEEAVSATKSSDSGPYKSNQEEVAARIREEAFKRNIIAERLTDPRKDGRWR